MAYLGHDTFTRASQSGTWGTATDGQVWSKQGAAGTINTNGAEGTIASTAGVVYEILGSNTATNCEALVRLSPGSATDSGEGINLRHGGATNWYSARLSPAVNQFK